MISSKFREIQNQRGMSLIELLVAAAVGLVLLAGVYKLFIGTTDTYSTDEQLSRVQETGRFALDYLARDIRMAGYRGCASSGPVVNTLNDTSFIFDFSQPINGFQAEGANTWDPAKPAAIVSANSGSDILTLRNVSPFADPVYLEGTMPNTSADLKVPDGTPTGPDGINDNDILLIGDCEASAVFQVSNYTSISGNVVHNAAGAPPVGDPGYPGNATKNLGHAFQDGAEVMKIQTFSYFILDLDGQPTLFRKVGTVAAAPLVEGVESFQVLFGEDTTGSGAIGAYRSADAVVDWDQVLAVRVMLLVRSPNQVTHGVLDDTAWDVDQDGADDLAAPNDRRLRQVFSSTISLRNRLP